METSSFLILSVYSIYSRHHTAPKGPKRRITVGTVYVFPHLVFFLVYMYLLSNSFTHSRIQWILLSSKFKDAKIQGLIFLSYQHMTWHEKCNQDSS